MIKIDGKEEKREAKEYIKNIAKSSAYFSFRNGPIKKLYEEEKISDEEMKQIQEYMQDHLAYLYTVLLEENNIQKFDLIVSTMNKFYVNDDSDVKLNDDGFDNFYKSLFK
ncbi:hypothetical protein [uncultured Clostridium sp.]|uniref:hypothetical protein n=1 Tax=uncultured Clostridium sp. TaxID=59620 RepID=UPI00262C0935|nr:hypothetical protein [uncultured Clostridium sp.]